MHRLVKILPRESLVPELGYLVFTKDGLIAWNGTVGIRFARERAGARIMQLVDLHGPIVVQNGAKFLKVLSVLDKIDTVSLVDSHLIIKANSNSTEIKFAVLSGDAVPQALPHLALDWKLTGGVKLPITGVWLDALDFLTNEGAVLWGDVVGIYDRPGYTVAFDYGLLLYSAKSRQRFKGVGKDAIDEAAKYCPWLLLQLGLATITEAVFKDGALFLVGDGIIYFTALATTTSVLDQILSMRQEEAGASKYKVALKFSSNVWKRAKLFNKLVLTLSIKAGVITLSGGSWSEIIGSTDAPDKMFITRISLLQKWALKTLGHQFAISENGNWLLTGRTRNEVEFYGSLTMVQPALNDQDDSGLVTPQVDEDDGNAEEGLGELTRLL